MPNPPRLALIHATRLAIEPIETAAQNLWPQAEIITILEEGLSIDRAKDPELSDDLSRRILALACYAQDAEVDGILFTCSAFGPAIDQARAEACVPVMKPNEAMFDQAFAHGDRIAMLYTFPATAGSMGEEFREEAKSRGRTAQLTSYFCEGALEAKRGGDDAGHDRLITEAAASIKDVDAIMLAQFSMAGAVEQVRKAISIPVLTSPDAAMAELRRRVENAD